jgi:hypothetical protein
MASTCEDVVYLLMQKFLSRVIPYLKTKYPELKPDKQRIVDQFITNVQDGFNLEKNSKSTIYAWFYSEYSKFQSMDVRVLANEMFFVKFGLPRDDAMEKFIVAFYKALIPQFGIIKS